MYPKIIKLTGDYNDYPQTVIQEADMVITKTDKVCKEPGGPRYHRQATKAEIDAAELVDPPS